MRIDAHRYDLTDPDREARLARLVGPADGWRDTRDFQLRLLSDLGLRPQYRLLDLGCGTLRAGLPLIGFLDPGRYTGVDADADCIAEAQALVADFELTADKAPTLVHSPDFGRDSLGADAQFDVIWCYQVFIHLTPVLTDAAMAAIARRLAPSGRAFVTVRVDQNRDDLTTIGTWRHFALTVGPLRAYIERARAHGLTARTRGTLGALGLPDGRGGAHNPLLELEPEPRNV